VGGVGALHHLSKVNHSVDAWPMDIRDVLDKGKGLSVHVRLASVTKLFWFKSVIATD